MKNDYLWDKTGEDFEIERMENALKAFRYQPVQPPILPKAILQTEEKQGFNIFPKFLRFAFAGMACLMIALMGIGIWFQGSNKQIDLGEGYSAPSVSPIYVDFDELNISQISNSPVAIKKPVQTNPEQTSKSTTIAFRQKNRKVKSIKTIQLTKEEKYAYNQLMLALSITGSKLKEVKDKANGIDEQTASIQEIK